MGRTGSTGCILLYRLDASKPVTVKGGAWEQQWPSEAQVRCYEEILHPSLETHRGKTVPSRM